MPTISEYLAEPFLTPSCSVPSTETCYAFEAPKMSMPNQATETRHATCLVSSSARTTHRTRIVSQTSIVLGKTSFVRLVLCLVSASPETSHRKHVTPFSETSNVVYGKRFLVVGCACREVRYLCQSCRSPAALLSESSKRRARRCRGPWSYRLF